MKKVLFSIVGLALCSSAAFANVPSPANCSVVPSDGLDGMILAPLNNGPLGATVNLITVRNSANDPIENASVVVTLSAANVVCSATILTGTTDSDGQVTLTLGGGGCVDEVPLSGVVKANGVTIRAYENVKSPDYDGDAGSGVVDISDLPIFTSAFNAGGAGTCTDYDNDGLTTVGDLPIFTVAFNAAMNCALP